MRFGPESRARAARRLRHPVGLRDHAGGGVGRGRRRDRARTPARCSPRTGSGCTSSPGPIRRASSSIPESDRPVVQVPLGGDLIHAPTGALLVQFRWVALDGRINERVARLRTARVRLGLTAATPRLRCISDEPSHPECNANVGVDVVVDGPESAAGVTEAAAAVDAVERVDDLPGDRLDALDRPAGRSGRRAGPRSRSSGSVLISTTLTSPR